jgi:hypothetical protein
LSNKEKIPIATSFEKRRFFRFYASQKLRKEEGDYEKESIFNLCFICVDDLR